MTAAIKFAEILIVCIPGVEISSISCPDDPSPATDDLATLTFRRSPDPCDHPDDPSPHDLTEIPNKPPFLTRIQISKGMKRKFSSIFYRCPWFKQEQPNRLV